MHWAWIGLDFNEFFRFGLDADRKWLQKFNITTGLGMSLLLKSCVLSISWDFVRISTLHLNFFGLWLDLGLTLPILGLNIKNSALDLDRKM